MKPSELRDQLDERRAAYSRVFEFGNPTRDDLQLVLKDLARFCRADASTYHPDARQSAMLDGRREVWLRIRDHLMLGIDDLFAKYHTRGPR